MDQASAENPLAPRVVTGWNVDIDGAGDAGAIRIDGDGIDCRCRVDIGRLGLHCGKRGKNGEARRYKAILRTTHDSLPQISARRRQNRGWSGLSQTRGIAPPLVLRRRDRGTGSIEVSVRRRGGAAAAGPKQRLPGKITPPAAKAIPRANDSNMFRSPADAVSRGDASRPCLFARVVPHVIRAGGPWSLLHPPWDLPR